MSKLDLKKELKEFYRASAKKPNIINVPEGKFITITGRDAPGGPAYKMEVKAKKGIKEVDRIILETFHEGLSAQIMHIGPYSEEGPTIQKLHDFIKENGYKIRGLHHEIYMSDPRRVPPERWKTIIRQPIETL